MSSHHNRRRRRQLTEVPVLIERLAKTEQGHFDATQSGDNRLTYEEANWARLSPQFRAAHNRLRIARGWSPIPEPKIDLYVKPQAPLIKPIDYTDRELIAAARQGMEPTLMGGGPEGFTINGEPAKA